MILVLAIISLLVTLGVFSLRGVLEGAEDGAAEADLKTIKTNLIRYRTAARTYPTTEQGLESLVSRPTKEPLPKRWNQYSDPEGIIDPWNEPYQYRNPGEHNTSSYDLFSKGRDKKAGTEDDITNW